VADFVLPTDPPTPPLVCPNRECDLRVDTLFQCRVNGCNEVHCEYCMPEHLLSLHATAAWRVMLAELTDELDAVDLKERADG